MKNRTYNCKDVDMVLTAKTVNRSFIANIEELSTIRSDWSPEYANALNTEIDHSIEHYLGLDVKKELRSATSQVLSIHAPALRDLSFLKTQITADFGSEAKEINKSLGLNSYLKGARDGKQDDLIQLLSAFKKGLTVALKGRIIEKGTNEALLDRIISYTDQMIEANVKQENIKGSSKEVTAEAVTAFNEIYEKIMKICKIASAYYKDDKIKKAQFTFKKVLANLGGKRKSTEPLIEG